MSFGTNLTFDALAQLEHTLVRDLNEQQVYAAIQQQLDVHNSLLADVAGMFADLKTENNKEFRTAVYGGNRVLFLEKVDEVGATDAQKVTAGQTVDFPLETRQAAIQWSRWYFDVATGAQLTKDADAIMQGDAQQMKNTILSAIFTPTNRTVLDTMYDYARLDVKALVNADGMEIPDGPRGQKFDGATHNHYLANNGLTEAAALALTKTVREHYERGRQYLFTNAAEEMTIRGFSRFTPYVDPRINLGANAATANGALNAQPLDDRAIGIFDQVEVWIKPWMPAGYLFSYILGQPKPVRVRQRRSGLYIAASNENFPLRADFMQHEYGAGVFERTNGAVLDAGSSTYRIPTLL